MEIPITGGDRSASNIDYRTNLNVNFSTVIRDIKHDQGYLISHDGLAEIAATPDIDRGGAWNSRQNKHFRVSGQKLITVNSDSTITEVGDIVGQQRVVLDYSFQTQGILSDTRFYLYDGVTPPVQVTDPDFGYPVDFVNINSIYIFTDGENIYHTKSTDESEIQGSAFATNEFRPDRTLALLRDNQNLLVVFDRYSTQWWRDGGSNATDDNFRFIPILGKISKVGIVGTHCKVELDGQLFILGNRKLESPSIHILTGSNEVTVATREIDYILEGYSEDELSQAVLESRVRKREKVLLVRLLRHTLEYNFGVGQKFGNQFAWTIIKSDIAGETPWRGRNGVFDPQLSKWVYGDAIDSKLGYLDDTTNLQYGEKVEEIFYTPTVYLESKSITDLEMDTLPGHANSNVSVKMSASLDGVAHGFEESIQVSEPDNYNTRCISRPNIYVRYNFSLKFRIVADGRTAFSRLRIKHD